VQSFYNCIILLQVVACNEMNLSGFVQLAIGSNEVVYRTKLGLEMFPNLRFTGGLRETAASS